MAGYKIATVVGLIAVLFAFPAIAQNGGGIEEDNGSIAQTVVDTLALLFLLFGAYIAIELYGILKGGELASSWRLLSGAVMIFALIKVIEVAERAQYFPVPDVVLSAGYLAVAVFIFFGFLKQRKTLG